MNEKYLIDVLGTHKKRIAESVVNNACAGKDASLKVAVEYLFRRKIKFSDSDDILNLLRQGKITVKESRDLMAVLKDKQELELLPDLIKKLDRLEKK